MSKPPQIPIPLRWSARFFLFVMGWKLVGDPHARPKAIIIGGGHTSNWDGAVGLAATVAFNLRVCWLGKEKLFRGPLGVLVRLSGGIPIDRTRHNNIVDQMIHTFDEKEHFHLLIAPEGTRKKAEYWKTGFYHIAMGAQVPIMFGFFDYAKKEVGIGGILDPSGDIEADMEIIRAYYSTVTPKYPERVGEIRLPPNEESHA